MPSVPVTRAINWSLLNMKVTHIPGAAVTLASLTPIALRKAKIVYNFGLFECNRVKFTAEDRDHKMCLVQP